MTTFRNLAVAALSISLSTAVMAQDTPPEPPPVKVTVDEAITESMANYIWVPGTVLSRFDAQISSEVDGRIVNLSDVGDTFKKGDRLAKVDDEDLQLTLMENESDLVRLQAKVTLLEKQAERLQKVAASQSASKDELDEKLAELAMARQDVMRAEINIKQTQRLIRLTEVTAPFDGMVVERLQQPGEFSHVGELLLRIVDTQNIEVSVRAPLSVADYIHNDLAVPVKSKTREMEQKIRAIVPVGNERSRMMEVRVALETGSWPIGAAVRVALPNSALQQVTAVHRDALILRREDIYVFVVKDDDTAKRVAVEPGVGRGDLIAIQGDLNVGDKVIVRGAERLQPGQKVRYEKATAVVKR